MAKTVCKILGVVFVLVGIAGFASHDLLGAHLNLAHNVVNIASGAIALYFGLPARPAARAVFVCSLAWFIYSWVFAAGSSARGLSTC